MANLGPPRSNSTRRDRGQIVLLAAFALAVAFVVLALVVNSAIFTENLATREEVAGSEDALDHRYEVQTNVEELILAANANNSSFEGDLQSDIEIMGEEGRDQQATLGRIANVKDVDVTDGVKIVQNQSRNFTSIHTDKNWTLVGGVDSEEIRNIQINVTDPEELSSSDPFQLVVNDTIDPSVEWNMTVTGGGSPDSVEIQVETADGNRATCDRTAEYVTIDVTGGFAGETECPALSQLSNGTEMWFGTGVDPDYDIEFKNGHNIEGTYSFIVDEGAQDDTNFGDPPEQPYTEDEDIIYSVDLTYEYYTPSVGYETDIRVAPGEPPE